MATKSNNKSKKSNTAVVSQVNTLADAIATAKALAAPLAAKSKTAAAAAVESLACASGLEMDGLVSAKRAAKARLIAGRRLRTAFAVRAGLEAEGEAVARATALILACDDVASCLT